MALFPAYAEESEDLNKKLSESELDGVESSNLSPGSENRLLDPIEEEILLNFDSEKSSVGSPAPNKKRKKKSSKKKVKKARIEKDADYYVDCKLDYGNLRVSTLYNPARPLYDYENVILGYVQPKQKKHKERVKRYFNMSIELTENKSEDISKVPKRPRSRNKKHMGDYIDITDSGITWSDSKIEEDLVERTAQFNKHLNANPYDVDIWLQYIKLQEDRMAFDICNDRVSSEEKAKNMCYEKQLSILNQALETNYNSLLLLSKKVQISEQCLPNNQYLSMLKSLVVMPGLNPTILTRVWFWYVEAVQCSMALCSLTSVKEMYAATVKGLLKAQGFNYQDSHIDVTYHLGLFLRQAGMWEQVWVLSKMNIEMNMMVTGTGSTESLQDLLPKMDENALGDEEAKIISSGLPTHSVWCRVEALRSRHHWLPVSSSAEDPQRMVFTTDLADFIKPVIQPHHQFTLIVNILRLYKIPLLPMNHMMLDALTPNDEVISWEYDSIESCLPFIYSLENSVSLKDPIRTKILATIFKDFSEEPNYFDVNGHFYQFVNKLMIRCSKWFSGIETTAILLWWIRLQRCLLTLLRWKDVNDQKAAYSVVRKIVKDVLKLYRDEVLLYGEFAAFEGQIFGQSRGQIVMETTLRAIPCNKSVSRVHLARSLVEMLLVDSHDAKCLVKSVNVLIAVATCQPLPTDLCSPCSDQAIQDALCKFSDHTNNLLLGVSMFDREMTLAEHMVPDLTVSWICCHGWLIYLTQSNDAFTRFYKKLDAATFVEKVENRALDCKRQLWLRENVLEWCVGVLQSNVRISSQTGDISSVSEVDLLRQVLEEFPSNASVCWAASGAWGAGGPMGRWRLHSILLKSEKPSKLLAIAFLMHNFVHLYKKEVPFLEDSWQPGHSNRLLRLLQSLSQHSGLSGCALIWKMYLRFVTCHTEQALDAYKRILYQALDQCPWDKGLYLIGCVYLPPDFAELVDLMVEKEIRLHTMPEELQPI